MARGGFGGGLAGVGGGCGGGLSTMQAQLAFVCSKLFVADDMGHYAEGTHLSLEDMMEAICYLVHHFSADLPLTFSSEPAAYEPVVVAAAAAQAEAKPGSALAAKLATLLEHLE